jgi:hypothetical protein
LLLEGGVGTRQRIGGADPLQQHRAGGELEVDIVGQEVGGSHVFVERIRTVTEQLVRLCETLPSFAEARVDLNRVAVLDSPPRAVSFARRTGSRSRRIAASWSPRFPRHPADTITRRSVAATVQCLGIEIAIVKPF